MDTDTASVNAVALVTAMHYPGVQMEAIVAGSLPSDQAVHSIEDPEWMEHLRQGEIHLGICPTCNVQTDIYPTYPDHKISRFQDAGISIGVIAGARTITNTTLSQEYQKLNSVIGWGKERFLKR